MRKLAALCLLSVSLLISAEIPRDKKIFIEKMENDLDGYIRAEFSKQKVPLTIVLDADHADIIMIGNGTEEKDRKWHQGWLTTEQDRTSGNVSVVDPKNKTLLWSGEAGDRSLWWGSMARGGQRKVAQRIVSNLKKKISKK